MTRHLIDRLREKHTSIPVFVGGTIPPSDAAVLLEMGVAAVFPTGTALGEIVLAVRAVVEKSRACLRILNAGPSRRGPPGVAANGKIPAADKGQAAPGDDPPLALFATDRPPRPPGCAQPPTRAGT